MNLNSELRPRRELINSNFEGYKLSLEKLPVEKILLENDVATFSTKENEIGFLNYALHAQHSSLFINRWNNSIYWFDLHTDGAYYLSRINCKTNAIQQLRQVDVKSRNVLPTVHFPLEEMYVVSTGDGDFSLYTEDTHMFTMTLPNIEDNAGTILVNDVQCDSSSNILYIAYTFVRVGESKCAIVISAKFDATKGELISLDEFESAAVPSYVAISTDFSIVMAADRLIKHECDKVEKSKPKKVLYKWRQSLSDVVVFLEFESPVTKAEVDITIAKSDLTVQIRDLKIAGKLFQPIDPEESTWTISDGGVEILLAKVVERGWSQVLGNGLDNDQGEELFNEEFVSQVHQSLGHLTTDHPLPEEAAKPTVDSNMYEECDRTSEFERVVFRFSDGEWTHKASLSANQILYWTHVNGKEKCLATRNDVDCCLWSPDGNSPKSPLQHVATFDAVGYIHAGKREIAYIQSPPNHSYSIIVEHRRRAMIYRKACALNSSLRNRTSGKRTETIGRQQLINLDADGTFLGVQCTDEYVFLLEKNKLWKVILIPENQSLE